MDKYHHTLLRKYVDQIISNSVHLLCLPKSHLLRRYCRTKWQFVIHYITRKMRSALRTFVFEMSELLTATGQRGTRINSCKGHDIRTLVNRHMLAGYRKRSHTVMEISQLSQVFFYIGITGAFLPHYLALPRWDKFSVDEKDPKSVSISQLGVAVDKMELL